jgi:hypothetical protein
MGAVSGINGVGCRDHGSRKETAREFVQAQVSLGSHLNLLGETFRDMGVDSQRILLIHYEQLMTRAGNN